MFNDVGPLEIVTLVVLAVIVFGPDKLPKVIQDVTRTIRKIREFSESAKEDIRTELGPEFKDFEFEDLNPKTFVRKQLMDGSDELGLKEIRSSFDLKKEISEITDVVNGRSIADGSDTETAAEIAPSSANGSSTGPDLLKKSGPDLQKKSVTVDTEVRPPFDADAT
ncbi:sec-independent translocase [Streptomyces sp. NPDC090052]|uniref:sec-independent translocase n=1 Tax=unclassified Streptomyces TaxID=2593676 RepID=UPI002257BB8D|nr:MULTISPECIES: sec-independent translocase [unclassified Streptomyces]MCX4723965.1 sec-independent translocase [Streptomyces sp. NBC_01306]WSV06488.1 sec-independent translocase [Streptomyces sp. NBC_01020]WSX44611.1 sec-independent translocase [Streptomyces sp. NBC_00963]WSX67377.1 sec-independent translocase [Streptomyces sp. NBC_00932]